jgi:hypothetical protein
MDLVTIVATPHELQQAFDLGKEHIKIKEHLNLISKFAAYPVLRTNGTQSLRVRLFADSNARKRVFVYSFKLLCDHIHM